MALLGPASNALRPMLKALIRGGIVSYDYGRQLFEEARGEARAQPQEKPSHKEVAAETEPQTPPVTTIPKGEPVA